MARKSLMIPIDADLLKAAVQKRGALSSLEEPLGVTRQAINDWMAKSRIPPGKLSIITKELDFTALEVAQITKKSKFYKVLFRTSRHAEVIEERRNEVVRFAQDFFRLDSLTPSPKKKIEVEFRTENPAEMAESILKYLGLSREYMSLETLISVLEEYNVHVLFLDFKTVLGVNRENDGTKAPRAFCVKEDHKYAIVIDSVERVEVVGFIIFHELTHIFSGHLDDECDSNSSIESKEQEKFCNSVAVEVFTPSRFFVANQEKINRMIACAKPLLPYRVEDIANHLKADFEGVVYALKSASLLTPSDFGYLQGVIKKKRENAEVVMRFVSPAEDDATAFWVEKMNSTECGKFLKLQTLVKRGILEGKVTIGRASEFFGTDEVSMEQLASQWKGEYRAEASN